MSMDHLTLQSKLNIRDDDTPAHGTEEPRQHDVNRKRKYASVEMPPSDVQPTRQHNPARTHDSPAIRDERSWAFERYWCEHGEWPAEYFENDGPSGFQPGKDKLLIGMTNGNLVSNVDSDHQQSQRRLIQEAYVQQARAEEAVVNNLFLKGSYSQISDSSKAVIEQLKTGEHPPPSGTLFDDEVFDETCGKIRFCRNAFKLDFYIGNLLIPLAECLAIMGSKSPGVLASRRRILSESVYDSWDHCIPMVKERPRPGYAVGFCRSAFTDEQMRRARPFFSPSNPSYQMATANMYFPFLARESSSTSLESANRRNAHSMALGVRAVVELFRYVNREQELDGQVLAFSFAHDSASIEMWAHYADIKPSGTSYYRFLFYGFYFQFNRDRRWKAYQITKNVYDTWAPMHLRRICSALDQLPTKTNFEMSFELPLKFSENAPQLEGGLSNFGVDHPLTEDDPNPGIRRPCA